MDEDFDRSDGQAPPREAADRSVTCGDRLGFGRGLLYSREDPVPGGPPGRRSGTDMPGRGTSLPSSLWRLCEQGPHGPARDPWALGPGPSRRAGPLPGQPVGFAGRARLELRLAHAQDPGSTDGAGSLRRPPEWSVHHLFNRPARGRKRGAPAGRCGVSYGTCAGL